GWHRCRGEQDRRRRGLAHTPMSARSRRDRTIRRGCGPAILAAAPERSLDATGEARVHLQQLFAAVRAKNILGFRFLSVLLAITPVGIHRTVCPAPHARG